MLWSNIFIFLFLFLFLLRYWLVYRIYWHITWSFFLSSQLISFSFKSSCIFLPKSIPKFLLNLFFNLLLLSCLSYFIILVKIFLIRIILCSLLCPLSNLSNFIVNINLWLLLNFRLLIISFSLNFWNESCIRRRRTNLLLCTFRFDRVSRSWIFSNFTNYLRIFSQLECKNLIIILFFIFWLC